MKNRKYFALAEIIEQGAITIHDILYLIENKIITTQIRLFDAIGKFCVVQDNNGIKYPIPMKESEVSGLFELALPETRTIIKNGSAEISRLFTEEDECDYIDLNKSVKVDFYELVISSQEKEHLESLYDLENNSAKNTAKIVDLIIEDLPNGYTLVKHKGKEYNFGKIQASIIKILYEAHCDGTEWVYGKKLMEKAGSMSNRLCEIFKRHAGWRDLIVANKQGLYRLKL